MEKIQTFGKKDIKFKMKEPSMYDVIMHNDDYTTMDFVIMVLENIFRKEKKDAVRIMWKIHNEGSANVGTYTKDIAKSKAKLTMDIARQNGFPLLVTIEESK